MDRRHRARPPWRFPAGRPRNDVKSASEADPCQVSFFGESRSPPCRRPVAEERNGPRPGAAGMSRRRNVVDERDLAPQWRISVVSAVIHANSVAPEFFRNQPRRPGLRPDMLPLGNRLNTCRRSGQHVCSCRRRSLRRGTGRTCESAPFDRLRRDVASSRTTHRRSSTSLGRSNRRHLSATSGAGRTRAFPRPGVADRRSCSSAFR
jgi:hypothetical protein